MNSIEMFFSPGIHTPLLGARPIYELANYVRSGIISKEEMVAYMLRMNMTATSSNDILAMMNSGVWTRKQAKQMIEFCIKNDTYFSADDVSIFLENNLWNKKRCIQYFASLNETVKQTMTISHYTLQSLYEKGVLTKEQVRERIGINPKPIAFTGPADFNS